MQVRLTSAPETNKLNPQARPPGLVETEAFCIFVNEQGMPIRISTAGFDTLAAMTGADRLRWHGMTPARPSEDELLAHPDLGHRPHRVVTSTCARCRPAGPWSCVGAATRTSCRCG